MNIFLPDMLCVVVVVAENGEFLAISRVSVGRLPERIIKSKPRGNSHINGAGILVGNFKLNPYKRPIWAWPKLILTPK